MTEVEFTPWPKTPRLFRNMVVTEKIDGTNAAIRVTQDGHCVAQSRNRIITPENDNAGFAAWVREHESLLIWDLGVGIHFGEWWGDGIQRGYGLPRGERRFSLFNTVRHLSRGDVTPQFDVPGLGIVPVLFHGTFSTGEIGIQLRNLATFGSKAAPGFMRPEGVCVYHSASRQVFKVLIENDEIPKAQYLQLANENNPVAA